MKMNKEPTLKEVLEMPRAEMMLHCLGQGEQLQRKYLEVADLWVKVFYAVGTQLSQAMEKETDPKEQRLHFLAAKMLQQWDAAFASLSKPVMAYMGMGNSYAKLHMQGKKATQAAQNN
jgi:hypothetical protein